MTPFLFCADRNLNIMNRIADILCYYCYSILFHLSSVHSVYIYLYIYMYCIESWFSVEVFAIHYVRIEMEWTDKLLLCGCGLYALTHSLTHIRYMLRCYVQNADTYKMKTLIRSHRIFLFLSLSISLFPTLSALPFFMVVGWLNNGRSTFTHHHFFFFLFFFIGLGLEFFFYDRRGCRCRRRQFDIDALYWLNMVHTFIYCGHRVHAPWIFSPVRFFISLRFIHIQHIAVDVKYVRVRRYMRMRGIINIIYERVSL